jgi:guanylate kinase
MLKLMNKKGELIVLSGPSGSGKGTLLKEIFARRGEKIFYSISATTRSPREGERDGIEYYFLSKDKFQELIDNDGMLEHAEYCGNFYGTPKAAVFEKLLAGIDVVLEIEVQGAMQIRQSYPKAIFIFNMPPSFTVLEKRLRGRGTEIEEVIRKRLHTAIQEISYADQYDYIIINDEISIAADEFEAIAYSNKCKSKRMKDFVDGVLCDARAAEK